MNAADAERAGRADERLIRELHVPREGACRASPGARLRAGGMRAS